MNLLFYCNNLNPADGGVERVTQLLSSFFEKNNIQCYYSYFGDDYNEISEKKKIKLNENDSTSSFIERISNFIHTNSIEFIINQDQMSEKTMILFSKLKNNPNIKTVNCLHINPHFYHYSPLYQTFKFKIKNWIHKLRRGYTLPLQNRRRMYHLTDKFIVLSNTFKKEIAYEFGINLSTAHIESIPNPIPFPHSEFKFIAKQNIFLIVARMEENQKNLSAALRIWKKFEENNSDYQLILAGYGPDKDKILNYAHSLNIKRMQFIGKSCHPENLYKIAKFFLMTSNYEGFSMTLLECMQYGCIPMVYNSFSSVHDIIINEVNGYLIQYNHENEFVSKMKFITSHEQIQLELAQNAYNTVENNFSLNSIGKKWLTLIHSMTNNSK